MRTRGATAALVVLAALFVCVGCSAPSTATGAASRTPTATPTTQQHILALAQTAVGGGAHVEVMLDAGGTGTPDATAVTVAVTLAGPVPGTDAQISAAQEHVKTICFQVERTLWTAAALPLSAVTVTVVGPIYDDYADLTSGPYGAVVLKRDAATALDWGSLTPDTAWEIYGVFLRPAYRPKTVGL